MTSWNFDISQAPRGKTIQVERTIGKNTTMVDVHVPDMIIAAGNEGVVTISKWLPEAERWNMFTKEVPPFAWTPWPTHPHANQEASK